jgi:hypothetical protein
MESLDLREDHGGPVVIPHARGVTDLDVDEDDVRVVDPVLRRSDLAVLAAAAGGHFVLPSMP